MHVAVDRKKRTVSSLRWRSLKHAFEYFWTFRIPKIVTVSRTQSSLYCGFPSDSAEAARLISATACRCSYRSSATVAELTHIILAGAPETKHLRWDEDLLQTFDDPLRRFLGQASAVAKSTQDSSHAIVKWRTVPMHKRAAANSTKPQDVSQPTQTRSFDASYNVEDRTRFLEHTLALLDKLQSSQIAPADETTIMPSTFPSFATTGQALLVDADYPFSAAGHSSNTDALLDITNLRKIPNAQDIISIQPQTVTVNVLAATISVSPSRTVSLRKRTGEMDIIELVIGDETRAGFGISFWLTPLDSQRIAFDELRDNLRRLRPGDVVLVQNVALSPFQGCVYGQSLSKRFSRNATTVTVLREQQELPAVLRSKFQQVALWRDQFVGRDDDRTSVLTSGQLKAGTKEALPPDTPP
ncbi:hypothetical protein BAUCODRAFT_121106 [Baudoinia panamericana UAMH 10762]|uniref:Uncharacterized protein n=1 Tax=Baudoinia panamericana (strain UAMH 10762) TaxID=717646 RepID=M2NGT2_BAUPA|nr:uncharacterized protein BAUCODRAFT_121106 [Baudoinia panamericana UAMH 10762]EMC98220.1 hypothetical protein BAUCODRAFT_121106 [Baudoinia panamericana UAMH 10762]